MSTIHEWQNTTSSFASDDYIGVDGETLGSRKMSKDSLLELTAQNAIKNIVPEFSSANTYAVGNLVTKDGTLYKCITAHSGNWNSQHFTEATVNDEFVRQLSIASEFVPNVATVKNKLYWYDNNLYICNVAYTGAWNSANFTAATLGDLITLYGLEAATEADLVAGSTLPIMTANGPKALPGNTIVKASEQAALTTYAQNVAHSIAPEFDATTGAVAGKLYMHEGSLFVCKENTSGDWDASKFEETNLDFFKNDIYSKSFGYIEPNTEFVPSEFKTISNYYDNVEYQSYGGIVAGTGYLSKKYFHLPAGKYKSLLPTAKGIIVHMKGDCTPQTFVYNTEVELESDSLVRVYLLDASYIEDVSLVNVSAVFNGLNYSEDVVEASKYIGSYKKAPSDGAERCKFNDLGWLVGYRTISNGVLQNDSNYATTNNMTYHKGDVIDIVVHTASASNTGIYFWKIDGTYLGAYSFGTVGQQGSPISNIYQSMVKIRLSPDLFDSDVIFCISGNANAKSSISFILYTNYYEHNSLVNFESTVIIDRLDKNFNSPFEYSVLKNGAVDYTAKGDDDAVYKFKIPLNNNGFNVRFQFLLTEDLYRTQQSKNIINIDGVGDIKAVYHAVSQYRTVVSYQGQSITQFFPSLYAGVRLGGQQSGYESRKKCFGPFALSVKYIGNNSSATIKGNADSLVLKSGSTTYTYSYGSYETIYDLYQALLQNSEFEVKWGGIEGRLSTEIIVFPECTLVNTNYSGLENTPSPIYEYVDKAEFFVPLSLDEYWHQIEIFKIGDKVYFCTDGHISAVSASIINDYSDVIIGGVGMKIRDLEINCNSIRDAEIVKWNGTTDVVVSGVNPFIAVFEGHEMYDEPSAEYGYANDKLGCTADRIDVVAKYARSLGYEPVTIESILNYLNGNGKLPKRCMTFVFDDFQFDNFLKFENRSSFTRNNLTAYLAVITGWDYDIMYDGEEITPEKAMSIGKMQGFGFLSHTHNHYHLTSWKPSEYKEILKNSIVGGDKFGVNAGVLVYPYGEVNGYVYDVMQFMGFRGGVQIYHASATGINIRQTSPYSINRIELGNRQSLDGLKSTLL